MIYNWEDSLNLGVGQFSISEHAAISNEDEFLEPEELTQFVGLAGDSGGIADIAREYFAADWAPVLVAEES